MPYEPITITLSDQRLIDGFVEAANRIGVTPEEAMLNYVKTQGRVFADTFKIGLITSGAFIRRFTSAEFGAILAAAENSSQINDLIVELTSSPQVALDDERLLPGLQLLVTNGLLQESRIPEILDYVHPESSLLPNYPDNPYNGMSFYDPDEGVWWKYLTASGWVNIDFPTNPVDAQQWTDTDTNILWEFSSVNGGWAQV